MKRDDELAKRLDPKFPSTWSPDRLREHFERMKTDLPAFVTQYQNKPAERGRYHYTIMDDLVDEAEERPTATGTLALTRDADRRFQETIRLSREDMFRGLDIDEETLGYDDIDEELEVKVSIKKLNNGHVLIKAGCQERVVHSMEELYSMVRALLRVNVPETLFLKGGKT